MCQLVKAIHFLAEAKDHKTIYLLPDTIPHVVPIGGIHFLGVVPDLIKTGKVRAIRFPGGPGAFLMLQILQVYADPKARNDQD